MTSTAINFSGQLIEQIERHGSAFLSVFVNQKTVSGLITALENAHNSSGARHGRSGVYAMRNILDIEEVRAFAQSEEVRQVLAPILGAEFLAVRGILFDKTPGANWKVGWHQDLSIAVKNRADVPGFGPWSQKAGVTHVQPPREILEQMLTIRLHLDECDESNGPLRVLPGSHKRGKMTPQEIKQYRSETEPVLCVSPLGGALLMRPLLLHASSPATSPNHRRVLHIEFAAKRLPGSLEWITRS
jgi:ectoine hydroxylase-related dioxygenase (phytanoyl-CoA dioxygenase family)